MEVRLRDFTDTTNRKILDKLIDLPPKWEERVIKYNKKFYELEDQNGWFSGSYLRKEGLVNQDQHKILKKRSLSKLLENKQIKNNLDEKLEIYRLKQDTETYKNLRAIYSKEPWTLVLSAHSKFITSLHADFLINAIRIPLSVTCSLEAATKTTNEGKALEIAKTKIAQVAGTPAIPLSYWNSYFENPEEFNSRFDELTNGKDDWLGILKLLLGYWKKDFTSAPKIEKGTCPYTICLNQIDILEKTIKLFEENEETFNRALVLYQALSQVPGMEKVI